MDSPIVLCIDDRPHLLELRKAALESQGFSIETVSGESAAMRVLERKSVDAVLLDYEQEGMDVESLAYDIKQRFPRLPIVMLLPASVEVPERILWLVDEYVMKGELPQGLVRAIQQATSPTNADQAHNPALRSKGRRQDEPAA